MRADAHVVADLDLVVQANVLFQHGIVERTAIDGGVGANLAVVADHHATLLRYLDPVAGIHRQPETVGAQHSARVDQHALAQAHADDQGDPRDQLAAGPDDAIVADDAVRADDATLADFGTGADADEGTDMRAGRYPGRGVDHRAGMDARWAGGALFEQRRDLGEGRVRVLGDECRARRRLRVIGTQHDNARGRFGQLRAVAGIGKEGELVAAGAGEGRHAVDGHGAVAMQAQREALGERGGGKGGNGHGAQL